MLLPVHVELANNNMMPSEAAEEFATLITAHLSNHSVIHSTSLPTPSTTQHRERAIVCLSKRLATIKNKLRKNFPDWVEEVMHCPETEEEFDMTPITPGQVKRMLQKYSPSSSPGTDQITYFHLRNLPSAHHFLATLFSKILLMSHRGPTSWFSAEITLIHKGGDPSHPSNFRPIAMSSVIPKLFHKILAKCLEVFLLSNGILNPNLQKGFLTGINGTTEHIFTTTAIIDNTIQHGTPLAITFLDLQNAFSSVAHTLITDMLTHIRLPNGLISYIVDGYTKLSATEEWKMPPFKIKQGMFQGDTSSPVIFLTVFNPLVEQVTTFQLAVFLSKYLFQTQ